MPECASQSRAAKEVPILGRKHMPTELEHEEQNEKEKGKLDSRSFREGSSRAEGSGVESQG